MTKGYVVSKSKFYSDKEIERLEKTEIMLRKNINNGGEALTEKGELFMILLNKGSAYENTNPEISIECYDECLLLVQELSLDKSKAFLASFSEAIVHMYKSRIYEKSDKYECLNCLNKSKSILKNLLKKYPEHSENTRELYEIVNLLIEQTKRIKVIMIY